MEKESTIKTERGVYKRIKNEDGKSVDWRDRGHVTPVKTQSYKCNSCTAFAVTGALEGQYSKKTGELVSLSEEFLVECNIFGSLCQGGGSLKKRKLNAFKLKI